MPTPLVGANATPRDEELIDTACYSRLVEQYMVDSYNDEYWAEHQVQPSAVCFGAEDGVFRRIPARHSEECGWYDPRPRPWYTSAHSVPKEVVIAIDLSHSMNVGNQLTIARDAASIIIDTLAVLDRVAVITFSSDAGFLLEDNFLVEATSENKKRLVEAIQSLEPTGGISNLYNAFNLTFDLLKRSSINSESSSRCNCAIILFTDGKADDGTSVNETTKIISFVQEQVEGLLADYSKKAHLVAYSVGENADTSLVKRFACSTNGIWRHLGDDESVDLFSAMSSYYKLFTIGIADSEHYDYLSWVEPFYFTIDQRWGVSVSVPVFDRSVTPYYLLGVGGISMYMDSLERIHGENTTTSLLKEWIKTTSSLKDCSAIDPTECQLDTLRFLGGGKNATCGLCNSDNYNAGIVKEVCPSNTTFPIDLWHNIECELCFYLLGIVLICLQRLLMS